MNSNGVTASNFQTRGLFGMEQDIPFSKRIVENSDSYPFAWQNGKPDSNVIVSNKNLNVEILRYLSTFPSGKILYDAIAIKESRNIAVLIIRNQEKQPGLFWEWRPIPAKWFWACPGAGGDPEDEDNIATAKRETIEEIGNCRVVNSQKIGTLYQNTTFFENPVGLVLLDVEELETRVSQEEGIVDFNFFTKEEIMTMVREDQIEDTFTLSALMRYFALEGLD